MGWDGDGTNELSALFDEPDAPRERRRVGRGFAIAAWIVGVLVVLLVAAYLLADHWVRGTAERVTETAVAQVLPEGTVTGALTVKIEGANVIGQYLSGSFDRVEIDAPGLRLAGVTAPAHIVAEGVPTSISGRVKTLSIGLALDAKGLTALLGGRATVTALGAGTVTVSQNLTVNGVPITAQLTGTPHVADGSLTLAPSAVTVSGAPAGADRNALAAAVRAQPAAAICVADALPKALPLRSIQVTPSAATVTVTGANLAISSSLLTEKGTC